MGDAKGDVIPKYHAARPLCGHTSLSAKFRQMRRELSVFRVLNGKIMNPRVGKAVHSIPSQKQAKRSRVFTT
jgi:hypothetical protein